MIELWRARQLLQAPGQSRNLLVPLRRRTPAFPTARRLQRCAEKDGHDTGRRCRIGVLRGLLHRIFAATRQIASLTRHDASPMRRDAFLTRRDASLMRRDASPMRQDASLTRHDASLRRHDASLTRHDASLRRHDASLMRQDASLTRRDASTRDEQRIDRLADRALTFSKRVILPPTIPSPLGKNGKQ
jgi:hypothetical protein